MGKFIDINELREFCKQQNLEDEIRSASSLDKAKEIIKNNLPDGILASKPTIRIYRIELKTSQPNADISPQNPIDNSTLSQNNTSANTPQEEVSPPPVQDTSITTTPETTTPSSTDSTRRNIVENNEEYNQNEGKSDAGSSKSTDNDKKDVSEAGLKKTSYKKPDSKPTESITATIEGDKESVYVDKDRIKELDEASYTIKAHEKSITLLTTELEELKQKVNIASKEPEKKNSFLSKIPSLNDLLNSGSEKITVSINKDLLSKATRFVDANSLIRLENIIRDGYDLNSTIVQSILLAFIHQNSLL